MPGVSGRAAAVGRERRLRSASVRYDAPMSPPRLVAALAALALLAACKSPQEKLVERRREQRAVLDRLYSQYGGSGLEPKEEPGSAGIVGQILGEADRSYFEQQCLAVGRGERSFSLTAKLQEFLRRDDVQRDCRRSADLQMEIDALERDVPPR